MNKRVLAVLGIVAVGLVGAVVFYRLKTQPTNSAVTDFASCAERYPIQQSYPQVCNGPDGTSYPDPSQVVTPPPTH